MPRCSTIELRIDLEPERRAIGAAAGSAADALFADLDGDGLVRTTDARILRRAMGNGLDAADSGLRLGGSGFTRASSRWMRRLGIA